jgi:hypothetical protein
MSATVHNTTRSAMPAWRSRSGLVETETVLILLIWEKSALGSGKLLVPDDRLVPMRNETPKEKQRLAPAASQRPNGFPLCQNPDQGIRTELHSSF